MTSFKGCHPAIIPYRLKNRDDIFLKDVIPQSSREILKLSDHQLLHDHFLRGDSIIGFNGADIGSGRKVAHFKADLNVT